MEAMVGAEVNENCNALPGPSASPALGKQACT